MKCKELKEELRLIKAAILIADNRLGTAEGIGILNNIYSDDEGYNELKEVLKDNYEM